MRILENDNPQAAADQAIARLSRVGGEAGIIVIDRHGEIGWSHNSANFAVAYVTSRMDGPHCFLTKQDEQDAIRNG